MRSRAAAELLAGAGFKEVYSLKGGLHAWQGLTAAGPPSQGLGLISGGEGLPEMLAMAYGLELGLRVFYAEAAGRADSAATAEVLTLLAQVEAKHLDRVWALYAASAPAGADRGEVDRQASAQMMEGGQEVERALLDLAPEGLRPAALLELAMALETQALDLYLRLARKAREEGARRALLDLAQDEKTHLQALAEKLEGLGGD